MDAIDAVCFDAFGTLIHFAGRRVNPYRHLITATGEKLPLLISNQSIDIFARQHGLDHLIPVMRKELENEISGLQLFNDVEDVIQQLRSCNKKIAVCSNLAAEYGPVVRTMLPDMDAYVFSFEVGEVKPAPAIYQSVCKSLNVKPSKILFVGDSKRCDYRACQFWHEIVLA
jgi:HAD superfamily hydrolase (TIGR01509 family)